MTDNALVVAFSENGDGEMIPVSRGGRLATFDTIRAARRAAGALGVAAAVGPQRVKELCQRHELGLPDVQEQLKQERFL